jgi:hypothetical protein
MIEEHAELFKRICKLNDYVYSDASDKDDKVEFANKCIQLAAMKKYEEALRARLENAGIEFDDGKYYTCVGKIKYSSDFGSDFDLDKSPVKPNEQDTSNND